MAKAYNLNLYEYLKYLMSWQSWLPGMQKFKKNVVIRQSKMLAHRNPSNRIPKNFGYTLKLSAYVEKINI